MTQAPNPSDISTRIALLSFFDIIIGESDAPEDNSPHPKKRNKNGKDAANSNCYLFVPYFWYVRTNTKVKIICDENIKSPQPYITPRGTAQSCKSYKHEEDYVLWS